MDIFSVTKIGIRFAHSMPIFSTPKMQMMLALTRKTMKLETTNIQKFFNSMVRSVQLLAIASVGAVVTFYSAGFGNGFTLETQLIICATLFVGFPVLFFVWYYLMNSGPGRIENPSIELSSDGITLNRLGDRYFVEWAEYKNFTVSGFFSKTVYVNKLSGLGFKFEYYLFTPKQRKIIFSKLCSKQRS